MQSVTTVIVIATIVLCTQQKAPPKRPPEAGNSQTVVIRAGSIRISQPNSASTPKENGNTNNGVAVQSSPQTCEKPGSALRILVISTKPDPTTNHLMQKVAEVLAHSKHQVTLLSSTGHPTQPLANGVILKELDYGDGVKSEALVNMWTNIGVMDRLRAVSYLSKDMLAFCKKVYGHMDVIDWMRIQKFDIAVTSGVTCFQPLLRLAGIQRSVIVTSAEPAPWITETMGMPEFENPLIKEMSYFQRTKSVISSHIEERLLRSRLLGPLDEMGHRMVGDRYISLKNAVGQSSFLAVNSDELLDFPRPLTSQWVYIGGIDAGKRSSLSPYWNTILSMRSRSVLVSFGDGPPCKRRKDALLKAFSEIPDTTFIWQREGNTSLNQSNVVLVQNLPERDLLDDPRVSAVITDGRVDSLHDVLSGGKPVLCIPSDQTQVRNCHQLGKRGMAVVRDCRDLTANAVKYMIKRATTPEMRDSAKVLSETMASKTTSPEERLTRTVEFAAKYGSSVDLHSHDDDVGIIQRYHLDVFIPLALLSMAAVLLMAWIARNLWDKWRRSRQHKDDTGRALVVYEDKTKPNTTVNTHGEREKALDGSDTKKIE